MTTAVVPHKVQPPAALLPSVQELDIIKAIAATAGSAGNLLPTIGKRPMTAAEATVIMVYGRELGVQPMSALQHIYVVKGRPESSTQLKVGMMQAYDPNAGVEILERTLERARVRITYKGRSAIFEAAKEDAQRADLLGNPVWAKYPMQMLVWTATRTGVRIMAPDALLRLAPLPDVDELAPPVIEGDAIDVTNMEGADPSLSEEDETEIAAEEANGETVKAQRAGGDTVDISVDHPIVEGEPPQASPPQAPPPTEKAAAPGDLGKLRFDANKALERYQEAHGDDAWRAFVEERCPDAFDAETGNVRLADITAEQADRIVRDAAAAPAPAARPAPPEPAPAPKGQQALAP